MIRFPSAILCGVMLSCGGSAANNATDPPYPECPVPFEEPNASCEAEPPGPAPFPNWSSMLHWDFPPEAQCGAAREQYWLSGDETAHLGLTVASGPGYTGQPREGRILVLVDGLTAPFRVDGGESTIRFPFRLEAASSKSWELQLGEVESGKHVVNVVAILDATFIPAVHSADFVVLRNATCIADPLVPVPPDPAPARAGYSYVADGNTGEPFDFVNRDVFPAGDRIPLTWHLAPDDEFPVDPVLVVLIDGHQVPVGDLGLRPYVVLPAGAADREVPLELTDLPRDGAVHQVHLLMIERFDVPAVSPRGEPIPGRPYLTSLGVFRFRLDPA